MSRVATFGSLGALALQHYDATYEVPLRLGLQAVRLGTITRSDWAIPEPRTRGHVVGSIHWPAAIRGGPWSDGVWGLSSLSAKIAPQSQGPQRALTRATVGDEARARPLRSYDDQAILWTDDPDLSEIRARRSRWASPSIPGWSGVLSSALNPGTQDETWHPDFLGLVVDASTDAPTSAPLGLTRSTRVFPVNVLQTGQTLDDLEDADVGDLATLLRVVRTSPTETHVALSPEARVASGASGLGPRSTAAIAAALGNIASVVACSRHGNSTEGAMHIPVHIPLYADDVRDGPLELLLDAWPQNVQNAGPYRQRINLRYDPDAPAPASGNRRGAWSGYVHSHWYSEGGEPPPPPPPPPQPPPAGPQGGGHGGGGRGNPPPPGGKPRPPKPPRPPRPPKGQRPPKPGDPKTGPVGPRPPLAPGPRPRTGDDFTDNPRVGPRLPGGAFSPEEDDFGESGLTDGPAQPRVPTDRLFAREPRRIAVGTHAEIHASGIAFRAVAVTGAQSDDPRNCVDPTPRQLAEWRRRPVVARIEALGIEDYSASGRRWQVTRNGDLRRYEHAESTPGYLWVLPGEVGLEHYDDCGAPDGISRSSVGIGLLKGVSRLVSGCPNPESGVVSGWRHGQTDDDWVTESISGTGVATERMRADLSDQALDLGSGTSGGLALKHRRMTQESASAYALPTHGMVFTIDRPSLELRA